MEKQQSHEKPYVQPSEESVASFHKMLNVTEESTISEILESFEKLNGTKTGSALIEPKNVLVRLAIMKEIEKNHFFSVQPQFMGEPCKACRGTGELYRFERKTIEIPCKVCNSDSGVLKIDCPDCKGTGTFTRKDGKGTRCLRCKGDKKVIITCPSCHGKGKAKILKIQPIILATTPCNRCKEVGVFPAKNIDNPVLTKDVAKIIKTAATE